MTVWDGPQATLALGVGSISGIFPAGSEGNVPARNAGDPGSIPGAGRSIGEGNGNPLQYPCLENPMEKASVHAVAKSRIRLSDFTFAFHAPNS